MVEIDKSFLKSICRESRIPKTTLKKKKAEEGSLISRLIIGLLSSTTLLKKKLFSCPSPQHDLGGRTWWMYSEAGRWTGLSSRRSHPESKSWASWLPCDSKNFSAFKKMSFLLAGYVFVDFLGFVVRLGTTLFPALYIIKQKL